MAVSIFHAREGKSFFHILHPAVKFSFLIFISIYGSFMPLLPLLFVFSLLLFISFYIHLPIKEMKHGLIFFSFLSILIFITEYLSTKSIVLSFIPLLRFVNVLLGSLILADTTMPSDMARGIGSFLSPLLNKTAWKIASAIELTMAMIPLVLDTALSCKEARISRGGNFLKHPIRELTGLSISILSSLLDRVEEYADALSSRFYDNTKPRKLYRGFHKEEALTIFIMIILTIGGIWIKFN